MTCWQCVGVLLHDKSVEAAPDRRSSMTSVMDRQPLFLSPWPRNWTQAGSGGMVARG